MPLVNRIFAFWLVPGRMREVVTNLVGVVVVMACYALFLAVFAWVTA